MKTTVDFIRELEEVQELLTSFNKQSDQYYELAENLEEENSKREHIRELMTALELEESAQSTLALVTRLVSLRDDSMVQILKQSGRDEKGIERAKEIAYQWVSEYYLKRQEEILAEVEERDLLTPFYRSILKGVHQVGVQMTNWQPRWTALILNDVNETLSNEHDGDLHKVTEFLHKNDLIDKGHGGAPGDRSYSVLKKEGEQWKVLAYSEAFEKEVTGVTGALKDWHNDLMKSEDTVFHEKQAWLDYIDSLITAYSETNRNQLIPRWADVDRAWMKISGPIQVAHPLEYYEDHFRQAVALEWDVRIANPEHSTKGHRKMRVEKMAQEFYSSLNLKNPKFEETLNFCVEKLDSVQLHIGRVGLFYGADFCGLPSAQVVPNDEVVSREAGKKIFAFPDNIIQILRSRPFVRLGAEVFGQDFLKSQRKVLFQNRDLWFKIYDITTIGHEYGHILWTSDDTEATMNVGGHYKNVEEWKATTGGLVAFFLDEKGEASDPELREHILNDVIKRSVGLLAWRETSEVLPYYIEALVHLKGLFDTKVLSFDGSKMTIDNSPETYEAIKQWYLKTYEDLVVHYYLPKEDPTSFVERYAVKEGKYYMPRDEKIHALAEWYWDLYQKYGREIDTSDHRDNYKPFDQ